MCGKPAEKLLPFLHKEQAFFWANDILIEENRWTWQYNWALCRGDCTTRDWVSSPGTPRSPRTAWPSPCSTCRGGWAAETSGWSSHSFRLSTWNFFFLSMSCVFHPVINRILKVGCVLFAFFTCLTRVSDYKHHPEVARTKKNRNIKSNKKFNKYKNTRNIKTLCPGCGRGGLAGRRSCLPVAQLPAGKAEWSGDERHVDHLPLGSVHLPPLQQGGP